MAANISEQKEFQRKIRIDKVTLLFENAKINKKTVDESKLWMELTLKYHCSERKAKEYIKIAKYKAGYK